MKAWLYAAAAVLGWTFAAYGQEQCAPRAKVHEYLAKQHNEKLHLILVADSGAVLELHKSETGTWTILVIKPDNNACLVASGSGWRGA